MCYKGHTLRLSSTATEMDRHPSILVYTIHQVSLISEMSLFQSLHQILYIFILPILEKCASIFCLNFDVL